MKGILGSLAVVLVAAFALQSAPARADDDPALLDGGSRVTSTDGGRNAVAQLVECSGCTLAITCEGAQSTRYVLTADAGLADSDAQPLIYDKANEIGLNRTTPGHGQFDGYPKKRHIAFRTDDAGIPNCLVKITH